jgi:hypothetical protein
MRARQPAAVLVTGAALLVLFWGLGPRSAPPLYDGGPINAEPYRYLHPPPGLSATKPPSTIDVTLKLEGGLSPSIPQSTDEQPPQAELLAAQGEFALPPGTTAVHVTMAPVDPPAVAPPDGKVAGNVYRFAVTAMPGGAPLALRPGQQVTVVLRGPTGMTNPVLELWDGASWSTLDMTQPLGGAPDSYTANAKALGDIALVVPNAPSSSGGGGGGGGGGSAGILVAAVIIAAVMVAAAVVLVLRRR